MTHALNIVWNPSEGIDLGFFFVLQPHVCNCLWFRMVHHENEREGQSIEKLDSLFVWTVLATLLGARLGRFLYDWEYFRNHLIEILLP
jgi:prolipoprotein diacylglyceryltransferase